MNCPFCTLGFRASRDFREHLVNDEGVRLDLISGNFALTRENVIAAAMETHLGVDPNMIVCGKDAPNLGMPAGCGKRFKNKAMWRVYYCCNGCGQRREHTEDCAI